MSSRPKKHAAISVTAAGIVVALVTLLAGCDTSDPSDPPQTLGLAWLPALQKHEGQAGVSDVGNTLTGELIDLGDVPRGRDFYFAVTNSGEETIQNVRVTIDADSSVSVTPDRIASVLPRGASGTLSILRMTIRHGLSDAAVGVQPVLAQGNREIGVHLAGILDEADSLNTLQVWQGTLRFNALVADVSFTDSLGSLDSRRGNSYHIGPLVNGPVTYFKKHGAVVVRNTGNVDLDLQFLPRDPLFATRDKFVVPGDTLMVPATRTGYIVVGATEATRDPVRMRHYAEGESYFWLDNADE